jgi:hypothetical protein
MGDRLTATIGIRYDLEKIPFRSGTIRCSPAKTTTRWTRTTTSLRRPVMRSTTTAVGHRAGYGRFYDKTHFEIIGGLFSAVCFPTPFL